MKNSLLILILLAPFFSSCSTFSKFFASPPPAPVSPAYVAPRIYPEKINLSEIKVESINELPTEPIGVYRGSDGNNYLFFNLNYENSGLSVIEAIKAGEILDNNIIVRDQTGKIIGSDVVNFQAFSAVENKVFKNKQEVIRTKDGFETPVRPQSGKREVEPEISTTFQSKIYNEKEKVPQVIKLTELPPNNSYIAVNLELVYVEPFIQQICNRNSVAKEKDKEKEACTFVEEVITKEVREANKRKLDAIVSEYQKANDGKQPVERKSPKKFVLTPSEIQIFKDKMKTNVTKTGTTLEGEKTKVATSVVDVEKAKLNYREWNLVSAPKYFQINTETIKPLIGDATISGNSVTPAPPANTNSPINVNTPVENNISKTLPIEGFSDTVTLKNGTVYKNVKASIKESTVLITSQDGKTMEINKTELVSIKK